MTGDMFSHEQSSRAMIRVLVGFGLCCVLRDDPFYGLLRPLIITPSDCIFHSCSQPPLE